MSSNMSVPNPSSSSPSSSMVTVNEVSPLQFKSNKITGLSNNASDTEGHVSILPLLRRMWPSPSTSGVMASEIADALSLTFHNRLSLVQTASLLTVLRFTEYDTRADVIAACATAMRDAALTPSLDILKGIISQKNRARGSYRGGLVDIVGTGGDSHQTYNVSTTASIIASSYCIVAKHGAAASTSKSGSADVLAAVQPTPPNLRAIAPATLQSVYEKANYAFLFAPLFHPGTRHVAPIRKELGWPTIFNLLGPLCNPAHAAIEARVIGVARQALGPTFARALALQGCTKTLVVCGHEDLDEISCAGSTSAWYLPAGAKGEADIVELTLNPSDFGLSTHALNEVAPGRRPDENATILLKLLNNELAHDDPILEFVLINTAALLAVSGICDGDGADVITERGSGNLRWKEGVRLARLAITSGLALKEWTAFVEATQRLG